MKFWRILALFLIGGICFETVFYSIRIKSLNTELSSRGAIIDERNGAINGWIDYSKSIEEQLARVTDELELERGRLEELGRINQKLRDYNSGSEELNYSNYERYERLQAILRELASRATKGEKAE